MDPNRRGFSGSPNNGIDHRMEIMKSHRGSGSSSLFAWIQERKQLKEAADEERGRLALELAEDCTSCIFLWLPVDDVQRSSCVCKSWNHIIRSPSFIEAHLHHSESGLLCLSFAGRNAQSLQAKKTLSVEFHLQKQQQGIIFQREFPPQKHLHFLEIKNGVSIAEFKSFNIGCCGRVLGSCNGLVLLENKLKKAGLAVMNPATRQVTALPAGTIAQPFKESYGFAFRSSTKEHVAVHLFLEDSGYISCEILTVEKRKWASVNGPPSGLDIPFGYNPVVADGVIHWLIHNVCVLSMGVEEMKFRRICLPDGKDFNDGIVEIGGFLCFITHVLNKIDIWVLKSALEERWTKVYTISSGVLPDMVPVSGSRYCRWMILRSESAYPVEDEDEDEVEDEVEEDEDVLEDEVEPRGGSYVGDVRSLYIYDFHLGVMNKVRANASPASLHTYLPHVNSLLCG